MLCEENISKRTALAIIRKSIFAFDYVFLFSREIRNLRLFFIYEAHISRAILLRLLSDLGLLLLLLLGLRSLLN